MEKDNGSAWCVGDVIKWTTDYFEKKGVDSPRLTAEILLSHVLSVSRLDLYLGYDKPLSSLERSEYRELVRRRASREPLAYILGEKAFWKLDFKVTPSVLIPRPDTELMIETVTAELTKCHGVSVPVFFADLGTGSGAIALSILNEIPDSFAVAVDYSMSALLVASENADRNDLSGRVAFIRSSWCDAFSGRNEFDFVVSNPPYIKTAVIPGLEPEVSCFEPLSALDGGSDGLYSIRNIVGTVFDHIKPSGFLLMEIGYDQGSDVSRLLEESGFCDEVRIIRDYGSNDRLAFARKK